MNTSGKQAYELHTSGGGALTWAEVAERLGLRNANTARQRAKRWRARMEKAERVVEPEPNPEPEEVVDLEQARIERFRNELVLTSTSPLITSLDGLLAYCQADLDVWRVDHHILNAWSVAAKGEEKDLTWEQGTIIEGTIRSDGNLRYGQNVQVKAWMVRIEPLEVTPTIRPVNLSYRPRAPKPPRDRPFVRTLVWGDPQFGFRRRVNDAKLVEFHDRACIDVILQIAAACEPDQIQIIGDWFDAAEFTDRFLRSPEFYFTFQPAIYESHWWLTQFASIAPVIMHEGNHDQRIPSAVKRHLPFAYGMRQATAELNAPAVLSIPNLLSLGELGVEWIDEYPNDRCWLAERLEVHHGNLTRSKPGDTSRVLSKGNHSKVMGHIHRHEMSTEKREGSGESYVVTGFSPGCSCHVDHRVPGHTHTQTWTQGLGIVDVFEKRHFQITPVSIENGMGIWGGKLFEARDRVGELRESLPDWNW